MKIAISTIGSTGDIQPYLALAIAMKKAGHDVKAISHPLHAARFDQFEIPFSACGPEVSQQVLNEMLDKMLAHRNPLKQFKLLMEEAFFAEGEKYFQDAKAAMADREIVLCHMVDFLGNEAAAQLNIPRIGGLLAAAGIHTIYSQPPVFPNLGKIMNPLLWKLVNIALRPIDRSANRFLRGLVSNPKTKVHNFHSLSDSLNLIAASPTLVQTFPDLPAHFKVTGSWILENETIRPSEELVAFLEKYPKPIVVSFGSMGGSQGSKLAKMVVEAIELTGRAAIIQSGYAGLFSENAPKQIHFTEFVSHEWLFPQASCVVHHCGAGTTTAVARAGVPQIPITFIADQPYFAKQVLRLGIGVKHQWYYEMTAQSLAKSIQLACNSKEIKANAIRVQREMQAENGIAVAIDLIEKHYNSLVK